MKNDRAIGAERAAARLDRDTWLGWTPSRGFQMALALVDALIRSSLSHHTNSVAARIVANAKTMR